MYLYFVQKMKQCFFEMKTVFQSQLSFYLRISCLNVCLCLFPIVCINIFATELKLVGIKNNKQQTQEKVKYFKVGKVYMKFIN